MLTPSLAQEIARDTTAVIGFNVLITNAEGTVIGSGDESRVGSFHEASVAVMDAGEAKIHSMTEAHDLRGVRPGITLPLVIEGRAVGTVGITGSPAQVRRFGLVVQRQTEILLAESASLRSRLLRERALEDLLRDIATYDPDLVEPELVQAQARELGVDLSKPHVVVLVDVGTGLGRKPQQDASVLRSELLRAIREVFGRPQDLVTSVATGRVAVLHGRPSRGDIEADGDVIEACRRMTEKVESRYGVRTRVAIGSTAATVAGMRDSYRDADDALRLGAVLAPDAQVHTIATLRAHQLLASVGHRTRAHLVAQVTLGLRDLPDWPMLRHTIVVWCESGFSLVEASRRLHVHRNTLLYRLAKVERHGARSVRDYPASLALYLACLADQLDIRAEASRR